MDYFTIKAFIRLKKYINNEYFDCFILKNTLILHEKNYDITQEVVRNLFIKQYMYPFAKNILVINTNSLSNRDTKIKQFKQEVDKFIKRVNDIINYKLKEDLIKFTQNDINEIVELFDEIISELYYIQRQYSHELFIRNNIQYLDLDDSREYINQYNDPPFCPYYKKLEEDAEKAFTKYISESDRIDSPNSITDSLIFKET